jgi:hypothetical protein
MYSAFEIKKHYELILNTPIDIVLPCLYGGHLNITKKCKVTLFEKVGSNNTNIDHCSNCHGFINESNKDTVKIHIRARLINRFHDSVKITQC